MRIVTLKSFGDPSVLEVTEAPVPELGPGEVRVRVAAAGVNPVDLVVRSGRIPWAGEPPIGLGWDAAGTVDAVGPGVSALAPGDEVLGLLAFPRRADAYAEYVLASPDDLARKPSRLTFAQAAAFPLVALTAWQSLVGIADVRPGQRVLVHRAAGGVGHLAVQLAKTLGAHVIGTASAGRHAWLRDLGADELIDYRTADYTEHATGLDVVFDLLGGEHGERSARLLKPGGILVSAFGLDVGITPERVAELGIRHTVVSVRPSAHDLRALLDLVEKGDLTVHVDAEVPLDEAARAHELVADGHVAGKVVLVP